MGNDGSGKGRVVGAKGASPPLEIEARDDGSGSRRCCRTSALTSTGSLLGAAAGEDEEPEPASGAPAEIVIADKGFWGAATRRGWRELTTLRTIVVAALGDMLR
jgi:hypothetical protein